MARDTDGRLCLAFIAGRRVRLLVAAGLAVAVLAVGLLQLLPLLERKATIQSAETTEGTVTAYERVRNEYEVRYEYTVDGQTYENDRAFPGPYAPGGTASPQVLEQLPSLEAGETTTVYYSPAAPEQAWLTTRDGVVSRHVVYYVAAGFVALLLLTYVVVELKRGRRSRAGPDVGGPTAADLQQMASAMEGIDPQDPPSEEEMRQRFSREASPGQQSRTDEQSPAAGHALPGGSLGLFASVGRLLGLLRTGVVVLAVGTVVLLGSGYGLLLFLTP